MSFTYQQNDHLKTVKCYVDSVHSFIFIHMPLRDGFFGNGSGLKITKPSRQEINHSRISRMKQALWNS